METSLVPKQIQEQELLLYQAFVGHLTSTPDWDLALQSQGLTKAQFLSWNKAHRGWVENVRARATLFVDEMTHEVNAILVRQRQYAQQQAETVLVPLAVPAAKRLKKIIDDDEQIASRHLDAIKLLASLLKEGFVSSRASLEGQRDAADISPPIDPHDLDMTSVTITVKTPRSDLVDVTPG